MAFQPVNSDADDDAVADAAADLIEDLRDQLRVKELEIEQLQSDSRVNELCGVAVGVLLASTPEWTEHEAWNAWEKAAEQPAWTRHTRALLAIHVIKTRRLP